MNYIQNLSSYLVAGIIGGVFLAGFLKKIDCFEVFKQGAGEGFEMVMKLFANLLGIFVAIQMFRESGALQYFTGIIGPFFRFIGVPVEMAPLVMIRPISGSAALAFVQDILQRDGPDSYLGNAASVIMGSTETIFYTVTVYFGATGVKKTGHALGVSLLSDFINVITGCFILRRFSGG